jgi:hypothetical protein
MRGACNGGIKAEYVPRDIKGAINDVSATVAGELGPSPVSDRRIFSSFLTKCV